MCWEGTARLDLLSLGTTVQHLLKPGLAPSTRRTYAAQKKKYLGFCQELDISSLPVNEQKLLNFVMFVSQQKLKYRTMRSYLLAVPHLQVSYGRGDLRVENMPLLEQVLCKTRKEQSDITIQTRLPITPGILMKCFKSGTENHQTGITRCCGKHVL